MSAEWWDESRRNQLMGYGIRWGTRLAHLTKVLDEGPGANSVRPICGGVLGVLELHSGLDLENQEECEEWKRQTAIFPIGTPVEDILNHKRMLVSRRGALCPRCRDSYQKKLDREARK